MKQYQTTSNVMLRGTHVPRGTTVELADDEAAACGALVEPVTPAGGEQTADDDASRTAEASSSTPVATYKSKKP